MGKSKIEWTDSVWNPVTGCTKVSAGCLNCYAERHAKRFWKGRPFTDVQCHYERLDQPLHWKKPQTIFVCSMGDLFHKDVPWNFQYKVFEMMITARWHTFIILTKRPDIMGKSLSNIDIHMQRNYSLSYNRDNIILGVSVEDQKTADERIPILLDIPAKTRIVSIEPCLEYVNIRPYLRGWKPNEALQIQRDDKLNWVILGCESGANHRLFLEQWAVGIKNQCVDNNTPFFFKQSIDKNGNLVKMPVLDGRVWDQLPEVK